MKKKSNFLTIGLAIIFLLIAITVLVDLLGYLKSYDIFGQYWPIILVIVGVLAFSGGSSKESGFAFGMIILGILLLLNTLGAFETQAGKTILVILLGLSGLAILVFAVTKPPKTPTSKDR